MQAKSPHEDFCAELTRDLQDDPELRRDVSRELEAHLDDAVALARSRGLDETASEAEAMEHFGPASGLPQMLIEGNLSRMKSRARAKILIEWVLIPLCLIAALFIGWRESRALNGDPLKLPAAIAAAKPQTPEEERAMALRELTSCDDSNRAACFARARQLDPDNGWIDWMELAPRIKENAETQADFPELMAKAEKAFAKARWDEGVEPDLARRFRGINAAEQANYMQRMSKVGVQAAVLLPALGPTRYFGLSLLRQGTTSAQAGRMDEAGRCFRLFDKLLLRTARGDTLIGLIVAGALALGPEKIPGCPEIMAKNPAWNQTLLRCQHVAAVIKHWKELKDAPATTKALGERGSICQSMLIPALKDIEPIQVASLDPGRRSEYALIDRILAMVSTSHLFCLLLLTGTLSLVLSYLVRRDKPFLPLPRFHDLLRHMTLTCIQPLVLFEIYKLQAFSSHGWALRKSFVYFGVEQVIFLLILPIISCWLWQLKTARRLQALGVDSAQRQALYKNCLIIGIPLAALIGLASKADCLDSASFLNWLQPGMIGIMEKLDENAPATIPPSWLKVHGGQVLCGVLAASAIFWVMRLLRKDGRAYRACSSRALLPILALWILALGIYLGWLRQQEEYYGARDTMSQCTTKGFTKIEEQLVTKLGRELLTCWPEENR